MGYNLEGLQAYSRRPARKVLPPLTPLAQPRPASLLQAGDRQPLPSHIPSNFPPLPDPHAYIRTPVSDDHLRIKNRLYSDFYSNKQAIIF